MKWDRRIYIAAIIILIMTGLPGIIYAGDIEAELPSNDGSDAFRVQDSDLKSLMDVRSDGNVGIGTTSPEGALHIDGSRTGTGTISSSSTSVTGSDATFSTELTVGDTITADPGSGFETRTVTAIADDNGLTINSAFSSDLGESTSFSIGKKIVFENGNVGIGTTSPSGILDVEGGDVFIGTGTLTNTSASEDLSVTGNLEVDGKIYGDGSELTGVKSTGADWTEVTNIPSDIADGDQVGITSESDPVFNAWDKSTGVSIAESQISDLNHFANADVSITESQITDLNHFTTADETDPEVGINTTDYISKWDGSALVAGSIFDDGNVGIGTSTASARLEVNGDIRITSASGGQLFFADGSSMSTADTGSASSVSNAADAIITGDSDADNAGNVLLRTGSYTRLTILNTGLVGIGTGTPATALEVIGTVTATAFAGITESQISDLIHFTTEDETDPDFNAWDKSTGVSITESQISDLAHFTNNDETDPVFTAWDKSTGLSITESQINDLNHFTNANETDPVFTAWDKSTDISITESQISDLNHFSNANETDPVFNAWDKSTGVSITESQISDLNHFSNANETDPVFNTWDKSTGVSITESQISDLNHFTTADETDPEVGTNTANYVSKWDGSALVTGTIYDDGNIGIGTTSPGNARLSIRDNSAITQSDGSLRIVSTRPGNPNDYLIRAFHSDGATEVFTLTNAGNVGIRTPSPSTALEVVGAVTATSFVGDGSGITGVTATGVDWTDILNMPTGFSDNTDNGITIESDPIYSGAPAFNITAQNIIDWGLAFGWGDHSIAGYLTSFTESDPEVGINTTNYVSKWDGSSLVAGTIYDDGSIGICTTSPSAELDVVGTVRATFLVGDGSGITGISGASGGVANTGSTTIGADTDSIDGGEIAFQTQNDTKMTITNNGDVGIGTINPSTELDVVGTVTATAFVGNGSGLTNIPAGALGTDIDSSEIVDGTIVDVDINGSAAIATSKLSGPVTSILSHGLGSLAILSSITESQISDLNHFSTANETDSVFTASAAFGLSLADIGNWNTAFGWGNHSTAGYLTSFTETDPIFGASPASGIAALDITNWTTSFRWGDHSTAGYLTSFTESDPEVGTNTANYVSKWDGSALVTGSIYDDGNVGIGTSTASTALEVVGTVTATSFVGDGSLLTNLNLPYCGNGTLDAGEACDDGGNVDGDGCSAVCQVESVCGNGIVELWEECDDGNLISGDGCNPSCQIEVAETDPVFALAPAGGILGSDITNWNNAFGWGNHTGAGYLTSFTESDPVYINDPAFGITALNIGNWNTAFGWGDHTGAGYLTSFTETDPTVPTNLKDGVTWLEVSGRPSGLDDGDDVNDADSNPNNELQSLSNTFSGTNRTINITSGTGTTFSIADNDNSSSNELQNLSDTASGTNRTINITSGTGATFSIADYDNSSSNELQALSRIGTDVTLSGGGGTVNVADNDNSNSNELQNLSDTASGTNRTINITSGTGTTFSIADNDNSTSNEIQTLALSSNTLSITSGNSVDLSGVGSGGGSVWNTNGADIYNSNSGDVGIGIGAANPGARLDVNGSGNVSSGNGIVSVGPSSSAHISIDIDDIQAKNGTGFRQLYLNYYGGNVVIGPTSPNAKLSVAGGVQIGNDTASCSSGKQGTLRYSTYNVQSSRGSRVDMCMWNGTSYIWTTIKDVWTVN